jgi:hypothetical protein
MNFSANVQNAFDNNAEEYKNFNKLMLDYTKGDLDGVTPKQANEKIVQKFKAVLGLDEKPTKAEVRKALRKHQVDVYEIIEETVDGILVTGWNENPFFNEWVDVRNLAAGDKNEFYVEDTSVLSVMKISGNHHDIIRQRVGAGSTESIDTSWIGLKVYAEFERLLMNLETFADLVAKIQKAIDAYVNETIYNSLMGIGATLGTQWHKTGAITEATKKDFDTLIMDVGIASDSEVVVMGTRAALSSVYDLNKVEWASEKVKDEKYLTGRFGYYDGVRLVELKQGFKKNDTTQYLISNTTLFVMPVGIEPMIKLVYEGDTQMYNIQDAGTNMDMTYSSEVQTKLGVGVMTNRKFGMWDITV